MAQPKKNKKPRGKPPKGAPSPQSSSSAPVGSMEFPPPLQEAAPDPSPQPDIINEPVDIRVPNTPFAIPDYPYKEGLPGELVDVHVPKEISVSEEEREEKLKQIIQEITPKMEEHLSAYMASEKGKGFIKKTLISGFLTKDKGFSEEEVLQIADGLIGESFQKELIAKIIARASNCFVQDKMTGPEIWKDEELTGYTEGILQSSLNGIIDDECRRIIAEKEAEKAAAKKEEKSTFSPEQIETLDLIVGASKKAWANEVKKSENWGPGFTPEVVFQIIDGMTVGAIQGILKERKYSEDEIKKAIEYIMPQVRTT